MQRSIWLGVCLLAATVPVLAAQTSCDKVKADIQQKIIGNGVAESGFSLTIVPNDQADQPDAQVVGHCANDTQKILYTRTSSGNSQASSTATQDGTPAEPQ
ncbi:MULTISPECIES: DUF1161 domain-containing protein [Buttiauxella]|uniref:Outer membrane protein n=1 Tax=Buttiauxella ferragutiae ATCC 51602 TaxID=1354252 RepID=A0ABX2W567_9ENTR|nr:MULTISPECIES: DUF1161 domain-containing protein [Buttiauxella]MCE0826924.1 DUF1161 domain-containing protein [Buttiauxella ferragutiae]OAT25626.1 putative outer membrane protein [Buttiauxella ferragutiae ATCC 51602]TDN54000.1 uncharacterized protein DUF1161 [Buttiauxella sp. JUb87]UNK59506.1 DUF1161 domain-containing protein [Buttiauxella ferragutiae]